jgi:hypothetical protein
MLLFNCIVCGVEFVQTRSDRKSCDNHCACKLSRRYKDKYSDKMTKEEYIQWVIETGPFWKRKTLFEENKIKLKLTKEQAEKRETVRKFFLRCQSKKWQLTKFDILHLLMVYADLFPHRHTSEKDLEDPETFYTKCVIRIKTKLHL